ncbi:TlpA family protein disulfide reductase [Nocardioides sp. GXQ0305]|uniref:TlpA family protein disulfide reductase n=1 Tax=Nocardioides sp. GXQ0305 TaxID=3423912 RepID=UPI003D7CB9D2
MTVGVAVIVASGLVALAIGGWRAYADGRFRGTHPVRGAGDDPAGPADREPQEARLVPADELGERVTLLQFSSAFCAPCRAARRVLADVADTVPGVAHVEIDAEHHLDLVRRVGVLRTPTTLVLDARGVEVARAAGAPRREQVLAAVARALG